jgi:hypothetical protein
MAPNDIAQFIPLTGHCVCKTITFTLTAPPMITHCCHCTFCQRGTGSAFALNTVIECYNFNITSSATPLLAKRPSPSSPDGSKHFVAYCPNPNCNVDLYAYYGANKATVYVKTGVLDDQSKMRVKPDVHIFTDTKVEWVDLKSEIEKGVPVCEEFYDPADVWSKGSLERLEKLREWKAQQDPSDVTL